MLQSIFTDFTPDENEADITVLKLKVQAKPQATAIWADLGKCYFKYPNKYRINALRCYSRALQTNEFRDKKQDAQIWYQIATLFDLPSSFAKRAVFDCSMYAVDLHEQNIEAWKLLKKFAENAKQKYINDIIDKLEKANERERQTIEVIPLFGGPPPKYPNLKALLELMTICSITQADGQALSNDARESIDLHIDELMRSPSQAKTWLKLGMLYETQIQGSQRPVALVSAKRCYENAKKDTSDIAAVWLKLGDESYGKNDKDAHFCYLSVIAVGTDNMQVWHNLSQIYFRVGLADLSSKCLQNVMQGKVVNYLPPDIQKIFDDAWAARSTTSPPRALAVPKPPPPPLVPAFAKLTHLVEHKKPAASNIEQDREVREQIFGLQQALLDATRRITNLEAEVEKLKRPADQVTEPASEVPERKRVRERSLSPRRR